MTRAERAFDVAPSRPQLQIEHCERTGGGARGEGVTDEDDEEAKVGEVDEVPDVKEIIGHRGEQQVPLATLRGPAARAANRDAGGRVL